MNRLSRAGPALAMAALLLAGCGGAATPGAAEAPAAPATSAQPTAPPQPLPTAPLLGPTAAPTLAPTSPPAALPSPVPDTAAPAPPTPASTPATVLAIAPDTSAPAFTRALRLQSPHLQGDDIRAAQQRLGDLGYAQVGAADGIFGPNTDTAVRTFQTLNGLEVDGIIGSNTWSRLFSPSATPGSAVAPVVRGDTGWLMGGAYGDAWLDAQTTATLLRGNEQYRLLGAPAGALAAGAKPAPLDDGPCQDTFKVVLSPKPTDGQPLAVGGDWDLLPRAPLEETASAEAYQQAIAGLLRKQGIAAPDVQLDKVVRVDLEGDGSDEVLIAATHYAGAGEIPNPSTQVGDYSLVALQRTVDGAAQTIEVAGEYYTQAKEFAAPSRYSLVAVADLNGDGRMEIVIDSYYYEGGATIAYTIDGGQPREVLAAGCGV